MSRFQANLTAIVLEMADVKHQSVALRGGGGASRPCPKEVVAGRSEPKLAVLSVLRPRLGAHAGGLFGLLAVRGGAAGLLRKEQRFLFVPFR